MRSPHRHILLFLLLCCVTAVNARFKPNIPRIVKTWQLRDITAEVDTVTFDTLFLNFFLKNPIDKYSIANAYNATWLSAVQPKIYFDRVRKNDFLFADNYSPFFITPQDVQYYNTRLPYSNISYKTGGATYRKEDNVSFIFTGNLNRRTNLGITLEYLSPIGQYQNQASKDFTGSLFASYDGERYYGRGSMSLTTIHSHDNGGIATAESMNKEIKAQDIGTNLTDATSAFRYLSAYYNHGYHFGTYRERTIEGTDSVAKYFVPAFTISHAFQIDGSYRSFKERIVNEVFFENTFYNHSVTWDTAHVFNIKNTILASFEEGYTKAGIGITAYAYNEVQRYNYFQKDSTLTNQWVNSTRVGGMITRNHGKYVDFNVRGDVCVAGYKIGEFDVNGDIRARFRIGKDTVSIKAKAYLRSENPNYFIHKYASNHYWWFNDFDKTIRVYGGGTLSYPSKYVQGELKIGFENVSKLIYFGYDGKPHQHDGSVQVFSADLKFNISTKRFGMENNVVYQHSSSEVLPLPDIALYHSIYYKDRWFKVFDIQIGVDMRYHTKYYAPIYNPATAQFDLQNKEKVGNYPVLSAFINAKLKTVRFYLLMSHFNYWFTNYKYYSMPTYPLNPVQWKLGISWAFFD
ncbi:MAG TPA: hypothetical protein DEO38_05135 [Bacteroidales bacterium]|nr:hypothetical protein [Bacteroidales bacterium]